VSNPINDPRARFILARVAEREAKLSPRSGWAGKDIARLASDDWADLGISSARVRAECNAMRAIVRNAEYSINWSNEAPDDDEHGRAHGRATGYEEVLDHLTSIWSDHSDYDEEWTP